mmetsp:Transcript_65664/g.150497  ORF Transcript_65664/g.150497 Transcript_65664/m.150497 type:complete len:955 (+) Transcript_65664:896-3760(+)
MQGTVERVFQGFHEWVVKIHSALRPSRVGNVGALRILADAVEWFRINWSSSEAQFGSILDSYGDQIASCLKAVMTEDPQAELRARLVMLQRDKQMREAELTDVITQLQDRLEKQRGEIEVDLAMSSPLSTRPSALAAQEVVEESRTASTAQISTGEGSGRTRQLVPLSGDQNTTSGTPDDAGNDLPHELETTFAGADAMFLKSAVLSSPFVELIDFSLMGKHKDFGADAARAERQVLELPVIPAGSRCRLTDGCHLTIQQPEEFSPRSLVALFQAAETYSSLPFTVAPEGANYIRIQYKSPGVVKTLARISDGFRVYVAGKTEYLDGVAMQKVCVPEGALGNGKKLDGETSALRSFSVDSGVEMQVTVSKSSGAGELVRAFRFAEVNQQLKTASYSDLPFTLGFEHASDGRQAVTLRYKQDAPTCVASSMALLVITQPPQAEGEVSWPPPRPKDRQAKPLVQVRVIGRVVSTRPQSPFHGLMAAKQLRGVVESVYDFKLASTQASRGRPSEPLADTVWEYLRRQHGVSALLHQKAWQMVRSALECRDTTQASFVRTFLEFLCGTRSEPELIFYLYCRQVATRVRSGASGPATWSRDLVERLFDGLPTALRAAVATLKKDLTVDAVVDACLEGWAAAAASMGSGLAGFPRVCRDFALADQAFRVELDPGEARQVLRGVRVQASFRQPVSLGQLVAVAREAAQDGKPGAGSSEDALQVCWKAFGDSESALVELMQELQHADKTGESVAKVLRMLVGSLQRSLEAGDAPSAVVLTRKLLVLVGAHLVDAQPTTDPHVVSRQINAMLSALRPLGFAVAPAVERKDRGLESPLALAEESTVAPDGDALAGGDSLALQDDSLWASTVLDDPPQSARPAQGDQVERLRAQLELEQRLRRTLPAGKMLERVVELERELKQAQEMAVAADLRQEAQPRTLEIPEEDEDDDSDQFSIAGSESGE